MSKIIQVEARERLLSVDYIEALALALLILGLSRRKVLDWLAELIFGWLEQGNIVVDEFGNELIFTDETIDDVHGKDASVRVISSIIDYGRGKPRKRRPRFTMIALLRVYDSAFKIAGRAVLADARRAEVERMRCIVRSFNPVRRARYVNEVRKLRSKHKGERQAHFSAAVRRLRLRYAEEMGL